MDVHLPSFSQPRAEHESAPLSHLLNPATPRQSFAYSSSSRFHLAPSLGDVESQKPTQAEQRLIIEVPNSNRNISVVKKKQQHQK